jgi:hypothetical protein
MILGEERFGRERLGQWADAASSQVASRRMLGRRAATRTRVVWAGLCSRWMRTDRDGCSIAVAGLNRAGPDARRAGRLAAGRGVGW